VNRRARGADNTADTGPCTPAAQAAWLAALTDDYPVVVAVGAETAGAGYGIRTILP
jgi:hypothetical protein